MALTGDLGSGKTTFVQGLAEGLAIDVRVISPTFIIIRKYKIPLAMKLKGIKYFYHIDLYRLEGAVESELVNLGVRDILGKKIVAECFINPLDKGYNKPKNLFIIEKQKKIDSFI